jgi:large subunit ribosomal protein L1
MAKAQKHDATDTYIDENEVQDTEFEFGADTDEVTDAEDAAVNIDNETAQEATKQNSETEAEEAVEAEVKELDEEMTEEEGVARKHKNRESTSEKAKKSNRQSTSEKAKEAEEAKKKALDPLRLRGKNYRTKVALVDKTKTYTAEEAIALVKELSTSKFVGSLELHAKVKTENVRGTITLPHGNGKTRKVAVATDEVIEGIAAGNLDFDVLLATPAQMPKLAKYAKLLGPKGLMPSPKAGTVTDEIEKVTAEISGGRVEYRADKTGVVHMSIGKLSFTNEQLLENYKTMENILIASKVASISLAPTMGPGVKVALS